MSIKIRLVIAISVLVAVAFALTGAVTVAVTRAQMIDRVDDMLVASPAKPPRTSNGSGERGGPANTATATLLFDDDGNLLVANPSGYVEDPDPLPDLSALEPEDLPTRAGTVFTVGSVDGAGQSYRVLIRQMPDGGYLAVAASLDDVSATIRNLIVAIAITSLLILVALVLVVWFTVRRGLRPIDSMITTAGLIAEGDLSQRVENEDAATEVGKLGQALNSMLGRIENSFAAKEASERRLRQFVADASHELRTPLTSIRGYAELFRSGAAASPEALERVMVRIESEGARMGKLVEDLLLLARLDQGRPLRREPVDIVTLVEEAVMDAGVIAPGRAIRFDHPREAHVLGDSDRLRQVIDNLLNNARVHTDPETPIRVMIEATAREVKLSVVDQGPGIKAEDANRIFDRFYRVDASRSRANGGTGLGLSIVHSIVEAHGGRVMLDTTPGHGSTFTVVLARVSRDTDASLAGTEVSESLSTPSDAAVRQMRPISNPRLTAPEIRPGS